MSSVAITDNLAIRGAMKVAGINMPTNQRMIWEWIRDHPGQSCGSIQEGVKLKEGSVSAQLSQMIDRKMIDGKLAHSMRAKREIYHYTVVGKEYQTRPMSPGEKSRKIRNNEARGIKTDRKSVV